MLRDSGRRLAIFAGIDFDYMSPRPADPAPDIMQTQLKEVLDEIFAVDPISGFPKGDIQYYLSSEGNPQVKQWLENNLLKPRMSGGSSLEDITDDMRVEFSRSANESISDYQARLMKIYDDAKAEYEKSLNEPNEQ